MVIKPNRKTLRDYTFMFQIVAVGICLFMFWFFNKEKAVGNTVTFIVASISLSFAFFYSRKGEVYIPDAEDVLKKKTIYEITKRFYWQKDIGYVREVWPKTDSETRLVSFWTTPPDKGFFIIVKENSIKISDEDYNKIKDCHDTVDICLGRY